MYKDAFNTYHVYDFVRTFFVCRWSLHNDFDLGVCFSPKKIECHTLFSIALELSWHNSMVVCIALDWLIMSINLKVSDF